MTTVKTSVARCTCSVPGAVRTTPIATPGVSESNLDECMTDVKVSTLLAEVLD